MKHFLNNKPRQKNKKEIKQPDEFKVILLNDNYTTMSFVENILITIFHKNPTEANKIMLEVHQNGRGTAGIYKSWDIAVTKAKQVEIEAGKNEFPLQAIVELL